LNEIVRKIGEKHGRDVSRLLEYPNVILVYSIFQEKITKGKPTGIPCIKIRVSKKLPIPALKAEEIIPAMIEDIATDIEEGRPIVALIDESEHKKKIRPIQGGVSCGGAVAYQGATGTLTLPKVKDRKDGAVCALTNQHVGWIPISCGQGSKNQIQPGLAEKSQEQDLVFGIFKRVCEDKLDRPDNWNQLPEYAPKQHHIDACLITSNPGLVDKNVILHRGDVTGKRVVKIGETWFKTGRTTGCTGPFNILDDDAGLNVQYMNCINQIYVKTFIHQIIFENPNAENLDSGDSGSPLHTGDAGAVVDVKSESGIEIGGLCFAGSSGANGVGVAHHWADVEEYGLIELVEEGPAPPECEEGSVEIIEICPDGQTWKRRRVCKAGRWVEESQECPSPPPPPEEIECPWQDKTGTREEVKKHILAEHCPACPPLPDTGYCPKWLRSLLGCEMP